MIHVFWKSPLSTEEQLLLDYVELAHFRSAQRDNLSTKAVLACAAAGVNYHNTMAGALLTLGGLHGPIEQTFRLLSRDDAAQFAKAALDRYEMIPGWGNSFVKGWKDGIWTDVDATLTVAFPEMARKIESITDLLHKEGISIFPNPACYTAATAIILGLSAKTAAYLFVAPRLAAWSELYHRASEKVPALASP